MGEKLYLVKKAMWDSLPSLRGVPRRPQPIMQEGPPWGPYAGMVKLAFPHYWWSKEDLEEAQLDDTKCAERKVVESTPHGPEGQPFYEAFKAGIEEDH